MIKTSDNELLQDFDELHDDETELLIFDVTVDQFEDIERDYIISEDLDDLEKDPVFNLGYEEREPDLEIDFFDIDELNFVDLINDNLSPLMPLEEDICNPPPLKETKKETELSISGEDLIYDEEHDCGKCSYKIKKRQTSCDGCTYINDCPRTWSEEQIMKWIKQNRGIVFRTYGTYINNNSVEFSLEDVQQEAYLSIIKSAKAFDPGKNVKFGTYACKSIKNTLALIHRKKNAKKRTTVDGQAIRSLDSLGMSDDGENTDPFSQNMESICPNSSPSLPESDIMALDLEQIIYKIALEACTPDELAILKILINTAHTGLGFTQGQIAEKLNCSQAKISTTLNMLRAKLRNGLTDYDYYV